MVPRALEAASELAKQGVEAEVIDPRTLVPLDKDMILSSISKTKRCVIVQEACRRGGVASDICSIIQEEVFYELDAPIEIVAGLNIPVPFNLNLEKASVPQKDDIVAAAMKSLHRVPFAQAAE
jgi:pyruvate dehydrogenase E1 component beta subunit